MFWFKRRKKTDEQVIQQPNEGEALLELKGRTVTRNVVPVVGASILELADRNKVDWLSSCKRGTCARCRCLISEGAEYLTEPNQAEIDRLEAEEIDQGYRLGCQAKVKDIGVIKVKHASYF